MRRNLHGIHDLDHLRTLEVRLRHRDERHHGDSKANENGERVELD
jgi:hypothetical protein